MSDTLKVALAQYTSVVNDADANVQKAVRFINEASSANCDLILLPELFNSEYFGQFRDYTYIRYAETDSGPSLSKVREAAKKGSIFVAANFFEDGGGGHRYNTTALCGPEGEIVGKYRKTHPAAIFGVEKLFYRYGTQFPCFRVNDWAIGLITSDDNFYPEATRSVVLGGAEAILMPHAVVKGVLWEELFQARAFENSVYICVANKVGREHDFDFCGLSLSVDPLGKVIEEADETTEGITVVDLDRSQVASARNTFHLFRDRRPDLYGRLVQETDTF